MESAFILQEPLHVAIKQKALKQLQLNKGQITAGAVKGKSLTYYHGPCRKGRIFMNLWETIEELIKELLKAAPEDYEEIKLMLLAVNKHPRMLEFLEKMFSLVEERRPLLIEMK